MEADARFRPAALAAGRRFRTALQRRVRIDTRTLAVFRMLAGLLGLADLVLRSRNFSYFYTDAGVVPRSLVFETVSEPGFSIYHATTDSTVIAALFVLQGLVAVQLVVGYRTRVATVLSFLFAVSLDHHNPFVLTYADLLFRLLLFWAIFLPLGERWSVDAVHADRDPRPAVASIASTLILGQMVYMYVTNALVKSQSDIWGTTAAAPLVMGLDEMTFLLGDVVRTFPTLLGYGGLLWYYMLAFSWVLLVLRGRARTTMVGLFVGGHAAFAVTVRIGAFPYVALAGVILFLQAQFWDDATAVASRLGIDTAGLAARAARLERLAARVPDVRVPGERVRRLRGSIYTASIAAIVASLLFVAVATVGSVGPVVTDGDSERPVENRIDEAIEETLDETTGVKQLTTTASRLGIAQPISWGVFAGPDPRTTDRYYVFAAQTERGELRDVYNDRPLTYDRPYDELQRQHGTYRERAYMDSVRTSTTRIEVPRRLATHTCTQWAADRNEDLVAISMYVVDETVTLETIDDPANREREYSVIARYGCGDNGSRLIQPPDET